MRRLLLAAAGGGGAFTVPPSDDMPDQGQALPGTFTKSSANPIISNGAGGTWRSGWVDGVAIFRDERIEKYVVTVGGWNGSYYATGIFYIDDLAAVYAGTETPVEEAANPVFEPSGGLANIVAWTTMQMPDLTYRAYFQNYAPAHRIHLATSTDLVTWTHENGGSPVISPATGWSDTIVFDPYPVLLEDGTTRVIFGGENSGGVRAIGYALLDTDGITELDRGSLISPDFGLGDVSPAFGAPAPLGSATRYGLFHDHRNFTYGTGRSIDRNYTTDGSTFIREADVLQPDNTGFDAVQVFDSAPMWADGVLYLLFCGGNVSGDATDLNAKVGIASMAWPA